MIAQIKAAGLIYPETAVAISFHETGGWKGGKLMRYNNLFAFKGNVRGYYRKTGRGGFCVYDSVGASLNDYREYERGKILKYGLLTEERYRRYISRIYTGDPPEDPTYGIKLQQAVEFTKNL